MRRSTITSIRSAISSLAKLTNKDEPARWPRGAPSRPNGRLGPGALRHTQTALSRQISGGDFRHRIRPRVVIREQKRRRSSRPWNASRQYRIYSDNAAARRGCGQLRSGLRPVRRTKITSTWVGLEQRIVCMENQQQQTKGQKVKYRADRPEHEHKVSNEPHVPMLRPLCDLAVDLVHWDRHLGDGRSPRSPNVRNG